jgi:hypothetical protein
MKFRDGGIRGRNGLAETLLPPALDACCGGSAKVALNHHAPYRRTPDAAIEPANSKAAVLTYFLPRAS